MTEEYGKWKLTVAEKAAESVLRNLDEHITDWALAGGWSPEELRKERDHLREVLCTLDKLLPPAENSDD